MRLDVNGLSYQWVDNWVRLPRTATGLVNGRTHGVVVRQNGNVLIFNQARPGVLEVDPDGRLISAWGDRFMGAHGMTIVREGNDEFLWLTDEASKEVVKTTLDGETKLTLTPPDLPVYRGGKRFTPTWVAVNEERFGGNGDVWVADGYGSFYIHRYTKGGAYISSINGTEGAAGAFACPHGIRFDFRHGQPELYVADRTNHRIQVYDADGKFIRAVGQDFLIHPCMFAVSGEMLLVPELYGRLAILDGKDRLIGYLGENAGIEKAAGWPNFKSDQLAPGKFNSPHAMTADADGNLYVVEWIVGGRITKLAKL